MVTPDGPLLVPAAAACRMLNISRALFYSMHSDGRLGPVPVHFGRRVLWVSEEVRRWVSHEPPCPPRELWVKESRHAL
jgi:predicted DNA-binding transcriptional regulator AlpA